jgi:hypothetical protein
MPETVKLDKAQFQDFIKSTLLTDYARRELGKMLPLETKVSAEETPQTIRVPGVSSTGKINVRPTKQV